MQATYKENELSKKELERVVLFADLRGSSRTTGEQDLHNIAVITKKFYQISKRTLTGMDYLQFYGDEVLAIHTRPTEVVKKSLLLRKKLTPALAGIGLDVGIGIHKDKILYLDTRDPDIGTIRVGSSLNIAKRLEESSYGGDIIISEIVYSELTKTLQKEFKVKQEIKLRGWGLPIQTRVSIR